MVHASLATNLDSPDANGVQDIFRHRHSLVWPLLNLDLSIVDIGEFFTLQGSADPPLGLYALFLTGVNQTASSIHFFITGYDATGSFSWKLGVPDDPLFLDNILTFGVFTRIPGGPLVRTNSAMISIQSPP